MLQLYGANPDCVDHDHDGFSVLQGDCNDHNAAIHPGAVERPNRIDDNCDGVVDERLYPVPAGRNGSRPVPLTLPAEATATLAGVFAVDTYQFHLKSPGRVRFGLCPPSLDTDVQLTFTDRDGTQEASTISGSASTRRTPWQPEPGASRSDRATFKGPPPTNRIPCPWRRGTLAATGLGADRSSPFEG